MATQLDLSDVATKIDVIDKLYEATGAGDFDEAEKYLSDDFIISEAASLPFGGTYRGKSALRELYAVVMAKMSIAELTHTHLMVGETAACCQVKLRCAPPSEDEIELIEVFLFQGDKVCEIRPYYYDAAAVAANCS